MKVRVIWKPGAWLSRSEVAHLDPPPRALVDLRSHILWGLDDGARDLAQSLAMLKVAAAHGTTDIVATPRLSSAFHLDPSIAAQRLQQLRANCDDSIRIHSGCDFYFGFGNIRDALANPHKYTINERNYLVVELPDVVVPPATEEILSKLRASGVVPVIAHPERNSVLQRSMERLRAWVSMGCVLQVTARSLSGHFGKIEQHCAWNLLRNGLVHVVASDAHGAIQNPPRLDAAWRLIKHELGEDLASKLLIDNPRAILQGGALGRKPATSALAARAAAQGWSL